METGRIFRTTAAVLLLWCTSACDSQKSEVKSGLPIERTITDTNGRSLAVTIIGKDSDTITFIRKSDQKRYTIPLTKLSTGDRNSLNRFTNEAAPEKPAKKPQFIANREREIAKLRSKITRLGQEARSGDMDAMIRRQRYRQIDEAHIEIEKIEISITEYKWRMKAD
ncbi:MAG: hypothetical protein ACI9R3_004217 [Verrucomicrobiales bacterium]|jgi:hypothetical protein